MTDNLNGHIRSLREKAYKEQADPLFLSITEEALKAQATPDYTEWLALKDSIRIKFPYHE
jgi:hypothetical protein